MTTFLRKAFFLVAIVYAQVVAAQTNNDGLAAMQLEDWDKAISIYDATCKANPTDQIALLTLGNAYLAKNDKTKAKEYFDKAFEAKPDGPYAMIANARNLLLQDKVSEADEQFNRVASKFGKKDATVHRIIGESYIFYTPKGSNKPMLSSAEQSLKKAVDINNKDVTSLMVLGYIYKEMPNGGEAARTYELAESLEPRNPMIKFMLAKVYKAGKQFDRFLDYCDRTISVAPKFTPALRAKAEHLYFTRKWELARDAYKDLVTNGSDVKIEDEMQLANCLYITHDCPGVIDLVNKILAKDGSKNYLRRLLAYCAYDNNDFDTSLKILTEYFTIVAPEKILSSDYTYLGHVQIKMKKDTVEAIKNLGKAIAMDSTNWNLYKEIADLQYTNKDYCGSAKSYQMYLDSVPKQEATDVYKMGLAQYFCKDDSLRYEHAEKTFVKVTEMMPKATIGWLWAAKAAKWGDPSPDAIAADSTNTLASQYGKALNYYEEYIKRASEDVAKYKKDLITAYQYVSYCYFVKKDAEKFNMATAKWMELDPENTTIKAMQDAFGKDDKAPVIPKSGGGGKGK